MLQREQSCELCSGVGRVACKGPKNGCYGMHMGHKCPACFGTGRILVSDEGSDD